MGCTSLTTNCFAAGLIHSRPDVCCSNCVCM
jgi:hypothetical protein